MSLSITNDILVGADFLESPNQDARPDDVDISLLVIHNISLPPGEFGATSIKQFFLNELDTESHPFYAEIASLRVSAHLLIDRAGDVTQFVPFDRRAWHAGESLFGDRERCNDFSIGIELEGTDYDEFTDSQYASLARVTRALLARYREIGVDRIVGHNDIAPNRKTDPGPCFDWTRYRQLIES